VEFDKLDSLRRGRRERGGGRVAGGGECRSARRVGKERDAKGGGRR